MSFASLCTFFKQSTCMLSSLHITNLDLFSIFLYQHMAHVNNKTNCPVVVIDNLDSTIRDLAFDCFVLNRYGNYDQIASYNYLHANVTNIHDVCIVTVKVGSSLINFHEDKFTKGNHLRIENFTL
jgi:hypothetical protein